MVDRLGMEEAGVEGEVVVVVVDGKNSGFGSPFGLIDGLVVVQFEFQSKQKYSNLD